MASGLLIDPACVPQVESKPNLTSFDSSHEFSLRHLVEIYRLVKTEDLELEGYVFDDSSFFLSE